MIGEKKAHHPFTPTKTKNEPNVGGNLECKNLKIFYLITKKTLLMKLRKIMYFHMISQLGKTWA